MLHFMNQYIYLNILRQNWTDCAQNVGIAANFCFHHDNPNNDESKKKIKRTANHGGSDVMLWGCNAYAGVGNLHFIAGNMNQYMYLDIFRQNLTDGAQNPKHSAYRVRAWLLYNCPHVVRTPPQSLDINFIENL